MSETPVEEFARRAHALLDSRGVEHLHMKSTPFYYPARSLRLGSIEIDTGLLGFQVYVGELARPIYEEDSQGEPYDEPDHPLIGEALLMLRQYMILDDLANI